ncbi:hypothetical protein FE810_15590 [Thalassotalea litorea]|uniref:Uncharacterized protein n=1 Tax=Thalassotalea litorea TaxID=2020715 RepID=A0A5R9IEW0_9GAMM|nr:hypothetical protein FE810_15590 [Thalassotalea litorea]
MENSEVDVSFRFLKLDKLQAYTLKHEVANSSFREHHKNNCYVGTVLLSESCIDEINDFYVRQQVSLEDCDIFVSIVSEIDSNIVDVPTIVNRMLKYIDCKLTYSFTVV